MIGSRSIRARVVGAMLLVLTLTLLSAGAIVDALFMNRQQDALDQSLNRGMSYALAKKQSFSSAEAFVADVQETVNASRADVQVLLVLSDGQKLGAEPVGASHKLTEIVQADKPPLKGATITLWSNGDFLNDTRRTLDMTLLIVGALGLVAASALTVAITDVALRPLEVMVERAGRIAGGERGLRMASPVTATEVGQTAAAIDEMLDELESAEIRARAAETKARGAANQMQGFLSDAAHELKTPLAGIQAAADALIQLPDEAIEDREELSVLLAREAHRGGDLVNSLLEAARVDAGPVLRPEELDLADLAAAEKRRLSLTAPRLTVIVQGPDLLVTADRQGITSTLRNLVDNGARASGPTGCLMILLSIREASAGRPDMAVCTVVDSGGGIDPADRDRVFQRLVRLASTASTTKGSGLGLPIARGYARAHGGDVTILDESPVPMPKDESGRPYDVGAVFEFCMPLTRAIIHSGEPVDEVVATATAPAMSYELLDDNSDPSGFLDTSMS